MTDTLHVARAVAWRHLYKAYSVPSMLLPSLAFPLVFFAGFAGGLSRLDSIPGFGFEGGYTAFQYVFILLQTSAFTGMFSAFSIAADFEAGFARRMMLVAPSRSGIVIGFAIAAFVRAVVTVTIITAVALASGMQVGGGAVDLFGLYSLAAIVNVAAHLWGSGMAFRFRTLQAGPLMQMPIFLVLFMAPVFVPIDLLDGWIRTIADVNPATFVLEAGRGYIVGEPAGATRAFTAVLLLAALMVAWALRGLRRAEGTP